jgi:uncharacterized membrane protein YkoI
MKFTMKITNKFTMIFLSLLVALDCAAGAAAGDGWLLAQAAIDADQAAAVARSRTGGRVLGVEWGEANGQPVYSVRVLLPDGRIRVIEVPAGAGGSGR